MILLDTNVVVAFLNGNKSVLRRIQAEIDEDMQRKRRSPKNILVDLKPINV